MGDKKQRGRSSDRAENASRDIPGGSSPFRYHPDDRSGNYPASVGTGSFERVTGSHQAVREREDTPVVKQEVPATPPPTDARDGETPTVDLEVIADAIGASAGSTSDSDLFARFDAERVRATATEQDSIDTRVMPWADAMAVCAEAFEAADRDEEGDADGDEEGDEEGDAEDDDG